MTEWDIVPSSKVAWAAAQQAFRTLVIYFHKSLVAQGQVEGFSDMFGGRRTDAKQAARGSDLRYEMDISLEEALQWKRRRYNNPYCW